MDVLGGAGSRSRVWVSGGSAMSSGDPAEVLDHIAYLLERGQAPTYRVRAFRNAAASLRRAGAVEVRRLNAAGRLEDLSGVGSTTAGIVREVLEGHTPSYLTHLVETTAPAAGSDPAVAHLVGRLRGDCHSHSDWSDGGSPVEEMAQAARRLGHEYLVITDHSPRLSVAKGLSADRLRAQLDLIAE